jgi:hypothetical protein
MILDLQERQGFLLAANDAGQLLAWNITQNHANRPRKFDNNVSVVASTLKMQLDSKPLLGLLSFDKYVLAYGRNTLFLLDFSKLVEPGREGQPGCLQHIRVAPFLAEQESVRSVAAIGTHHLLIGSDRSNLILYDVSELTVKSQVSLAEHARRDKEGGQFATVFEQPAEITSIVPIFNHSLAFVSFECGRIFTVETEQLKIVNEVTACLKSPLEKIKSLYLK